MNKNRLLLNNEFDKYAKETGSYFFIEDEVIRGRQIGRTIGYPTINFKVEKELPLQLASYVSDVIYDNKTYKGYSCFFKNENNELMFETYILNFSKDVYGETIKVIPKKFISLNIEIKNLDDLKNKISNDIERAENGK